MIEIQQIEKRFGKLLVLDDLNLSINKGGVFAVLGPNGSGKTTILKMILGMVLPDKGQITFDGHSISKGSYYRQNIGYLPQIARFPDNLTVKELIHMIQDIRAMPSFQNELIHTFGLQPFLDKKLSNLSGGTRQKVNIVLTFMFDCPLYVLDEPTAGLDPISYLHLKELIQSEKEKGKIILITTHILSLVESMADEIIFLLEGKVHFRGTLTSLYENTGKNDLEHAIAALLQP